MCSLARLPNTGKCRGLRKDTKNVCKNLLRDKYVHYENALLMLNLETLSQRRSNLSLKFAKSGIKFSTLDDLFPTNKKEHNMKTRECEKFQVQFSNTDRLKKSSIPSMQSYLNEEDKLIKTRKYG